MKCEQIRELLSPYIDQMTDTKENNAIIAHLEVCPDCQAELKQLQSLTAMMRGLYTPQLPDNFAQELRQHLNDEKITLLKPRELKTPSKAGWIAAAVAVVALGAGILTSNFVPIDNIIAYEEQAPGKETKKTTISVEDILSRINIFDNKDSQDDNKGVEDNTVDVAQGGPGAGEPGPDVAEPTTPDDQPEQTVPEVAAEPDSGIRTVDIYSAQIKVDNTEEAIKRITQIAQANNAEYNLNATDSLVQAFSVSSSQMVELKVSPDRVNSLIKEFESMGMMAAPIYDETVLTDDYAEALKQIEDINGKITEAKASNDEEQLKQLNRDLYDWTARKTVIDNETNLATVRVYLVEEITP